MFWRAFRLVGLPYLYFADGPMPKQIRVEFPVGTSSTRVENTKTKSQFKI